MTSRVTAFTFIAAMLWTSHALAAPAGCGSKGGPGYRDPTDGKCVGWEELCRRCGATPGDRCTAEFVHKNADEAAGLCQRIRELGSLGKRR